MGWGRLVGAGLGAAGGFALGGPVGAVAGGMAGGAVGDDAFGTGPSKPNVGKYTPDDALTTAWQTNPGYIAHLGSTAINEANNVRNRTGAYWNPVENKLYTGDRNAAAEARSRQNELADYYDQVLAGKTPSVAELQLRQATAANNAAASSLASANGYNPLAARAALQAQAMNNQNAAGEAGVLRAQEQAAAAQGMGALTGQMRTQDLQAMGIDTQRAQALLQSEMGQRQLNDELYAKLMGMGMDAEKARLQAAMLLEQLKAGSVASANQFNLGLYQGDVSQSNAWTSGLMSGAGMIGAAGIMKG